MAWVPGASIYSSLETGSLIVQPVRMATPWSPLCGSNFIAETMIFPRKQSNPTSKRRAILEAEGLEFSTHEAQQAFWRRHNLKRRSLGRRSTTLGDLASSLLSGGIQRSAKRLRELESAWKAIVPEAYRSRSRVEYFEHGRLHVSVDSRATGFILHRQFHSTLLLDLNAHISGFRVGCIEFRAGMGESGEKSTSPPKKR